MPGKNASKKNRVQPYSINATAKEYGAVANNIFENGSRAAFVAGTTISTVQFTKASLVSTDLAQIFGAGWNFFDGIGNYVSAGATAAKLKTTKTEQARAKKTVWVALDVVMGTQLNVLTILTLSAQYNLLALSPALAATFLPLAAIGFAAGTWASFARSLTELTLAVKKLDPAEMIKDKLERYAHPSCTIEDQDRLQQQIVALYRCNKDKMPDKLNMKTLIQQGLLLGQDDNLDGPASDNDKELVAYLENKQQQKVKAHMLTTTRWGFAAVGMTLFALVPYFPSEPALLIAAIVFTAIAAAFKLYEMGSAVTNVYNSLAMANSGTTADLPEFAKNLSSADQARCSVERWKQGFFKPAEEFSGRREEDLSDPDVPTLGDAKNVLGHN